MTRYPARIIAAAGAKGVFVPRHRPVREPVMAEVPGVGPSLAVVLLNWKTPKMTAATAKRCLEIGYALGDFALIVVDNASGDDSVALLASELPDATILEAPSNLGFAGGVNLGIAGAVARGFTAVCLLNTDAEPAQGCFDAMGRLLLDQPRCGAVGATVIRTSDGGVEALGGGRLNRLLGTQKERLLPAQRLDYLAGTCLTLRTAALDEVGLLDTRFFMYWEDIDLSTRLRNAGWTLGCARGAVVRHQGQGTIGTASPASRRYFLTSMVRYFKKHSRVWPVPVAVRVVRALASRVVRGDVDGVRLILQAVHEAGG